MKNDSYSARKIRTLALAAAIAVLAGVGQRAVAEDPAAVSIVPPAKPISGKLVICGGGIIPNQIKERFIELAGGAEARLVVITTASVIADDPDEAEPRLTEFWKDQAYASLKFLHARSREKANDPEYGKVLNEATGVWFIGGEQGKVVDVYLDTVTEALLHDVLKRGGVIGGTSAGAAIMSRVMIRSGRSTPPEVGRGFGFLPGTVVDQHFIKRKRQDRLMSALERHPGLVGVGIDEGTALVVEGRRLTVLGDSQVVTCLIASPDRPAKIKTLNPGDEADLVALSRAAIARMNPRPVPVEPGDPDVPQGTLIVVGGGVIPPEAKQAFIAAAGGPEASILVISTALGDDFPEANVVGWLTSAGAKNVQRIHAVTPEEVQEPEFHQALRNAKGVWFTGGRQWRLVDAFLDTPVQKLFHEVIERGGVVGGTSAGATILGSYLVRGNPLRNSDIMAEGYERGFGLLPGVAIDQHFRQRNRFADMSTLKQAFPQLIGLGIDEGTALIVRGHVMEVVGRHQVAVYDQGEEASAEHGEYQALHAGDQYDLKERRRMTPEHQVAQATDEDEDNNDDDSPAAVESVKALLCP